MLKTELYENAFGWLAYDKTTYYTELYLLSCMQLKKKLSRMGGWGWVVGLTGNRANSAPLELGLGLSLAIISPTSRPLIKELLLS